MKNIEIEELEQYNDDFKNRDSLDKYMQVNLAHLEDDLKKYGKQTHICNKIEIMIRYCSEIHLRILNREKLEEEHIKQFKEINDYNTAKNKEIKRIAILAVVFSILAIITSLFPK